MCVQTLMMYEHAHIPRHLRTSSGMLGSLMCLALVSCYYISVKLLHKPNIRLVMDWSNFECIRMRYLCHCPIRFALESIGPPHMLRACSSCDFVD